MVDGKLLFFSSNVLFRAKWEKMKLRRQNNFVIYGVRAIRLRKWKEERKLGFLSSLPFSSLFSRFFSLPLYCPGSKR